MASQFVYNAASCSYCSLCIFIYNEEAAAELVCIFPVAIQSTQCEHKKNVSHTAEFIIYILFYYIFVYW
jgi:hypothetical protein